MVEEVYRVGLFLVFASAAGSKSLNWRRFLRYLALVAAWATPTQRRVLAILIIMIEGALALLVLAPTVTPATLYLLLTFIICASFAFSVQVVTTDIISCPCWGGPRNSDLLGMQRRLQPTTPRAVVTQTLAPPTLAVRNSLICAAGCYLLIHQHAATWSLMLLAVIPVALMTGALVISIRLEVFSRREPRHPRYQQLAPFLAPLVVLDYYRDHPALVSRV